MRKKEKQILDTFRKTVPELSELEKEKLLAFGEGMAFMIERRKAEQVMEPQQGTREGR